MGIMDNWTIVAPVAILAVMCIAIMRIVLKRRRRVLESTKQDIANSLGLVYENKPPRDSKDKVSWRIGGSVSGREVKLEAISLPRVSPHASAGTMHRLSVPCRTPQGVSVVVVVLSHSDEHDEGDYIIPHPYRTDGKICVKARGDFDPGILAGADILQVMASDRLLARLDIEESWIRLFYEFGSEKANLDRSLVNRAIYALIDLAEKIEYRK